MRRWKPNKKQKQQFIDKLYEQDLWLKELKYNKDRYYIRWNNNKSSLYIDDDKLKIKFRISTHHLPSHEYDGNYRAFNPKNYESFEIKEIITNSRNNIMKKAEYIIAQDIFENE